MDSPPADPAVAVVPASSALVPAREFTPAQVWLARVGMVVALLLSVALAVVLESWQAALAPYAQSPFGLLIYFFLQAASSATLILPVPGLALTGMFAALVHPVLAGVIAGVAQTLGELTGYAAGFGGQTLLPTGVHYTRIEQWMRRYGPATLFVLAVIPNPVFDVAGVVAGATHMPLVQFLGATALGKVIKNVFVAYLGFYASDALWQWVHAVWH